MMRAQAMLMLAAFFAAIGAGVGLLYQHLASFDVVGALILAAALVNLYFMKGAKAIDEKAVAVANICAASAIYSLKYGSGAFAGIFGLASVMLLIAISLEAQKRGVH